jgi:hypothetical protein
VFNDVRGTDRFIYVFLGGTPATLWRYDRWTDSYQGLFSIIGGTDRALTYAFDPSRNGFWIFFPYNLSPYAILAFYNIATNFWTFTSWSFPGLSGEWGTDAALVHVCPTYNAQGNDDYIYLIGNASTKWYRYSISGDSWTVMSPVLPAVPGAGCALVWTFGYNTDRLYFLRGGGSASLYYFTISSGVWSPDISYKPKTETFTTGTGVAYDGLNRIYIQKDATQKVFCYQLDEDKMYPVGTFPIISGTVVGCHNLVFVTEDGEKYLYYANQSGKEFYRMLIG